MTIDLRHPWRGDALGSGGGCGLWGIANRVPKPQQTKIITPPAAAWNRFRVPGVFSS